MNAKQTVALALRRKAVIPAFNIPYLPMAQPVAQALADENAVGMLQVARLEWEKFEAQSLEDVAAEYRGCCNAHTLLHLNHVPVIDEDALQVDFLPILQRAVDAGYQSLMVDGSRLALAENIRVTAQASQLAQSAGLALEAELGAIAGHEAAGIGLSYETLFSTKQGFTKPEDAARFARESGCDWLSVAAGSFHGAIAAATKLQKKPQARLDVAHIAALSAATGHMPLVLHGGSGIEQHYVLDAIRHGVAKINIGTEIRQPYELSLLERPGDIAWAQERVYQKTRWVLHDFLKLTDSYELLNDAPIGFA